MRTLFLLCTILLVACQADPGRKKVPYVEKKLVSKGVNINFSTEVDILFVIDDSGSMSNMQNILSQNSAIFAEQFFLTRFIDFHIGVTSSSIDKSFWGNQRSYGGALVKDMGPNYIERKTMHGKRILEDYIVQGTDGLGSEEFFSIVDKALSDELRMGENAGFYRDDAHLLIIFVTDTDDQSMFSPSQTKDILLKLKNGDDNKITIAGALTTSETADCQRDASEVYPRRLIEFIELMNGHVFNFCGDEFGVELVKVAQEVLRSNSTIKLTEIPVLSTIEVLYGSQTIPKAPVTGWTYNPDRNEIYLGAGIQLDPEPEGTKVRVKFEAVYK